MSDYNPERHEYGDKAWHNEGVLRELYYDDVANKLLDSVGWEDE